MTSRNALSFAGLVEFRRSKRARSLEQAVPRSLTVNVGNHERLVHQRDQRLESGSRRFPIAGADAGCRLEPAASRKDRKPAKQHAFAILEQRVAPLERRRQRLMARRNVALRRREHVEVLRDPHLQFAQAERRKARRRKFDRERDAVEPPADLGDRAGGLIVELEVIVGGVRALREEVDRGVRAPFGDAGDRLRRQR